MPFIFMTSVVVISWHRISTRIGALVMLGN